MPEVDEILHLSADFPPVSTEEWEAAIARDLKGADYEKKLVWRTEEGLAIRPYYRKEALGGLGGQLLAAPGHFPFVRGTGRTWEIAQDAKAGPKAIRADLLHEAGAHAIQELGYGIAAGVERLAAADRYPAGGHHRRRGRICLRGRAELFHRNRQTARRAHDVGAGCRRVRRPGRRRLPHAAACAYAAAQQERLRPLHQSAASDYGGSGRGDRRLRSAHAFGPSASMRTSR